MIHVFQVFAPMLDEGQQAIEKIGEFVRAILLGPGAMRTRMRAEAFPGEDPTTLPDPSEIGPMIVELAPIREGFVSTLVSFRPEAAAI